MTLILVPVIIVCAIGGTVGILKLIRKVTPGDDFPKDPVTRKLEAEGKKLNEQARAHR